ncbi:MAG: glycosyltransferase, partial [bacterium]
KIGINIKFDNKLARMIYAGCDAFLIPSKYEPCGLTQMIALRYGTIPIVRKTGGLADTIREGENGFVFEKHTKEDLLSAIQRAYNAFDDKKTWNKMIKDGMKEDFSWKRSMKEYIGLYKK